jgi:hypothetical protein
LSTDYKKGVREIVSRAQEINPEIGNYASHQPSGPDHFQITVSNGKLILPRRVAQNQQESSTQVTTEWVAEIANTFEKSSADARKHTGFVEKFLNRFK